MGVSVQVYVSVGEHVDNIKLSYICLMFLLLFCSSLFLLFLFLWSSWWVWWRYSLMACERERRPESDGCGYGGTTITSDGGTSVVSGKNCNGTSICGFTVLELSICMCVEFFRFSLEFIQLVFIIINSRVDIFQVALCTYPFVPFTTSPTRAVTSWRWLQWKMCTS